MAYIIEQFIKCPWCGKSAIQSGPQHIGFGINSLTYSCYSCKAITISAKHSSKEIDSVEMKFNFKED